MGEGAKTEPNQEANGKYGEAFQLSAAFYAECRHVSEFIASWLRQHVDGHLDSFSDAGRMLYGQFLRLDSWLRSLSKMNEPADFQAVCAGCRSFLEGAIDMVLVAAEPSKWKAMRAWEESAKLHHAMALVRYCQGNGLDSAAEFPVEHEFVRDRATLINRTRIQLGWVEGKGKPRHPPRWTNRGLDADAREADRHQNAFGFERFYETRYRELCWNVHGSAMVQREVRDVHFPFISGRALHECAELGVFCAELLVRETGTWTTDVGAAFERLKTLLMLTVGMALPKSRAELLER